jgi:geranylgeranylglycerol-phosphate geranylgeranyltransferase
MRLRTSAGAPLLAIAGWWILSGRSIDSHVQLIVYSAVAAFSFITFAQVYNDIKDVTLDATSKPGRPLPSGAVSMRSAWFLAAALAAASLGASFVLGFDAFILCGCCILAGAAYSLWLKGTVLLGNIVVALVSSCPFVLVAAAVHRVTPLLLLGQLLILCIVLGNEFYKTAADADADSGHGLRTMATVCRPRTTALAIALCWVGLTATFAACAFFGAKVFAAVGVAMVLVPAGRAAIASLGAADSADSIARAGHRLWRWAWALGLPTLVLLR